MKQSEEPKHREASARRDGSKRGRGSGGEGGSSRGGSSSDRSGSSERRRSSGRSRGSSSGRGSSRSGKKKSKGGFFGKLIKTKSREPGNPWKPPKRWKKSAMPMAWDKKVALEKQLAHWFRRITIVVAVVAVLGAIAMIVVVATQPDKTEEDLAQQTAWDRDLPELVSPKPTDGDEVEPEEVADPEPIRPLDPNVVKPKPLRPTPLPPEFGAGLGSNLAVLEASSEANLRELLGRYEQDFAGDQSGINALKSVFGGIFDDDLEGALEKLESFAFGDRIEGAVGGVILSRLDRSAEALTAFGRAKGKVQPAPFYFELALHHLRNDQVTAAYGELEVAAHKDSETLRYQHGLVRAAYELKKWRKVVEHVDNGIRRLSTPPADLWLLAVLAETRLGNRSAAMMRCREVVKTHPDSADAKLMLAMMLGARG